VGSHLHHRGGSGGRCQIALAEDSTSDSAAPRPPERDRPDIEIGPAPAFRFFDSSVFLVAPAPVRQVVVRPVHQKPSVAQWLDTVSVFIPKSIREPFLGDLCEDLERMQALGSSRVTMWWVVIAPSSCS